jgi:DNA-nicking Smr family endonuclease
MSDPSENDDDAIEHPLTDELDLHTFRPKEIGSLLPEYFRECRKRGWHSVRVIHGKGTGTLREGVHRLLDRLPEVTGYHADTITGGSWGATWVSLTPWTAADEDEDSDREQEGA